MLQQSKKRSRSRSTLLDLSVLPVNLFTLRGDAFYSLVKQLTSDDTEELLTIQRISTARCFLSTNPLTLFDLQSDDPSIVHMQNRLSFKSGNNTNIVLAGIDGDCSYLRQLFQQFLMANKKQRINGSNSNSAVHLSQQNSATTMVTPLTGNLPGEMNRLSITEHSHRLSQQIDSWWRKYCNKQSPHLQVVELDEYELVITDNSASVICSCGEKIGLPHPQNRIHYQLSNFYKHLTQNDQCTVIRQRLAKSQSNDENDDDDSSSLSSLNSSTPSPSRLLSSKKMNGRSQGRISRSSLHSTSKSKPKRSQR